LRLFSFGGYGLALAALALVVFGAYDSYPYQTTSALIHCDPEKDIDRCKFESGNLPSCGFI